MKKTVLRMILSVILAGQASAAEWYLSGYLPDYKAQTVYVLKIADGKIEDLWREGTKSVPAGALFIQTKDWIFPGMIDLHGHLKYHVLPLWKEFNGRFQNRFEWRDYYPPYKQLTTFNMRALPTFKNRQQSKFEDMVPNCGAIRWAELKALVAGVTAVQGIGIPTQDCGKDFAASNVDIPGDLVKDRGAYSTADLIDPNWIRDPFMTLIAPHLEKSQKSDTDDETAYTTAYQKMLFTEFESGWSVTSWLDAFQKSEAKLNTALKLLTGRDFGVNDWENTSQDLSKYADEIRTDIAQRLLPELKIQVEFAPRDAFYEVMTGIAPPKFTKDIAKKILESLVAKKTEEAWAGLMVWIFDEKKGFLSLKPGDRNEKSALQYLYRPGVTVFPTSVLSFIKEIESNDRQKLLARMKATPAEPVITHVSEGASHDGYNQKEYGWVRALGLARQGLIAIHGVGMSDNDFEHAAKNGVSIVWSPLSNLTLYGSTLDVGAALRHGVNVTLGADWPLSGSKNLIDELKLAWDFIQTNRVEVAPGRPVTARDLVRMVTIAPAKALQLETVLGRVGKNYQADLTLVKRTKRKVPNGFLDLIYSGQENIELVVVKGEPLYGEKNRIANAAAHFGDKSPVEALPLNMKSESCRTKYKASPKALRLPSQSRFDQELAEAKLGVDYTTVAGIERDLSARFATYRGQIESQDKSKGTSLAKDLIQGIDSLYACEDEAYTTFHSRFVREILPQYNDPGYRRKNREGLHDGFDPTTTKVVEMD